MATALQGSRPISTAQGQSAPLVNLSPATPFEVYRHGQQGRIDLSAATFEPLAGRIQSIHTLAAPASSYSITSMVRSLFLYVKLALAYVKFDTVLPSSFQLTLQEQAPALQHLINHLQLEGLVPPLFCVLLKQASNRLDIPDGGRVFQDLCLQLARSESVQRALSPESMRLLESKLAQGQCKEVLESLYLLLLSGNRDAFTLINQDVAALCQKQIENQSCHYLLSHLSRLPASQLHSLNGLSTAIHNRDQTSFKAQLYLLLKVAQKTHANNPLRHEYYNELANKLNTRKDNLFTFVADLFKAEEFYKNLSTHIKQTCATTQQQLSYPSGAGDLERIMTSTTKTYQIVQLFLKDRANLPLPSDTQSALLTGIATRAFRSIDQTLSQRAGKSLHLFCGCHLNSATAGKHTPFMRPPELDRAMIKWKMSAPATINDRGLKDRSMLIMSFGVGGAHNTLQRALAQRAAEEGSHIYLGDGAEDAIVSADLIYRIAKSLGIKYSTAEFLDGCNRKEAWNLLQFMHKFFGGEDSAQTKAEKNAYMRQFFLERSPDAVMTTYARHSGVMATVCHEMGLGLYSDNTDFDPELVDITSPPPGHFVHALHLDTPEVRQYLKKGTAPFGFVNKEDVLHDHQIAEGGLPVQNGFFLKGGEAALRTKYNIEPDAQVVVIMSGGGGSTSLFADQILKRYQKGDSQSLPKLHVFVVCGNNPPEKARSEKFLGIIQEQRPVRHAQGKVAFTVYPAIPGDSDNPTQPSVSELMRLAQHKTADGREGLILSGKGGGGTFAEAAAVGVRVAARDYSPWIWEKFNMKIWCHDLGMGKIFTKDADMWPTVHHMLTTPRTTPAPFADMNSKEKSMAILRNLVQKTDQDVLFASKRAAFREM